MIPNLLLLLFHLGQVRSYICHVHIQLLILILLQSGRNRKAVDYVEDLEDDEGSKSFLQNDSSAQNTDGDKAVGLHSQNHSSTRSPSLILASSAENLASGFCTDEADTGQFGQGGEDDYLRAGGGFCVEDGEMDTDLDGPGNSEVESSLQKDHGNDQDPNFADMFGREDYAVQLSSDKFCDLERASSPAVQHNLEPSKSTRTDNLRNASASTDNMKGDPQISLQGSLSAMPFLRRKRKNP